MNPNLLATGPEERHRWPAMRHLEALKPIVVVRITRIRRIKDDNPDTAINARNNHHHNDNKRSDISFHEAWCTLAVGLRRLSGSIVYTV